MNQYFARVERGLETLAAKELKYLVSQAVNPKIDSTNDSKWELLIL